MVRQQLVIGAALLAGAAIGFCLAPEGEKRPAEAEAEPQAKAAIADRGDEASAAALRARVKTLEAELVKVDVSGQFCPYDSFSYNGQTITYMDFLTGKQELGYGGIDSGSLPNTSTSANGKRVWSYDQVQTVISLVEDKMDALNTISQETLITLQSLTAKRDQTYDMVSNILKSLNNVLVGNANNM